MPERKFKRDDKVRFNSACGSSTVPRDLEIENETLVVRDVHHGVPCPVPAENADKNLEIHLAQYVLVGRVDGSIIRLRRGCPLWFDAEMFVLVEN